MNENLLLIHKNDIPRGKGKKKVEWKIMYDAENEVMRFNF